MSRYSRNLSHLFQRQQQERYTSKALLHKKRLYLGCVHALSRSFITWNCIEACKSQSGSPLLYFYKNWFLWKNFLKFVVLGTFYLHASFPRLAWTYFDRGGVMANCCFAASNWQFRICGFDSRKQAKVITDNGLSKLSIKFWNARKIRHERFLGHII